jgi:nucleoside-diphosphate-sugar epimerase
MKMALVTGAAGFIGRHLLPKLESAGYDVIAVDPAFEPCERAPGAAATFPWYFEDWIEERAKVFDVVVHLAANITCVDKRFAGFSGAHDDIALDIRMARFIRAFPPSEVFIYPSSAAIDNPEDSYAWVKLTGERLCGELHQAGIPTVIFRPTAGYGFGQKMSYQFPAVAARAMKHEDPLTVWGDLYAIKDWIHIDDLSEAFVWAIRDAPQGIPIDICTGIGTPQLDFCLKLKDAVGYEPSRIEALPEKPNPSMRRVGDPAMALAHGFEAKISLDEGIRRYLQLAENSTKEKSHGSKGPKSGTVEGVRL